MFKRSASPLSPAHFAFMRAVVQGLDWEQSWARYLGQVGQASTPATLRATVEGLRLAFAVAARRARKPGLARLVLMDASRVHERPAPALPDLASFALDAGLEEFSHAEQVAAFEVRYGRASLRPAQSRRMRLVERQLAALRWLEQQVDLAPRDGDLLAAWLSPRLCLAFDAVGLSTIGDLVDWMRERGATWMRPITSLGPVKAARLAAWLRRHGHGDDLLPAPDEVGPRSMLAPIRAQAPARGAGMAWCRAALPACDVRPLELYQAPSAVPGSAADVAWVVAWVAAHGSAPDTFPKVTSCGTPAREEATPASDLARQSLTATQRTYRRETERLLLWSHLVLGRSLAMLDTKACLQYLDFLAQPTPRRRWCGPRGGQRWSACWRPFEGPLTENARRHALAVLRSFFKALVTQGHLQANPWLAVAMLPPCPTGDSPAALRACDGNAALTASLSAGPSATVSPLAPASLRDLRASMVQVLRTKGTWSYARLARLRWQDLPSLAAPEGTDPSLLALYRQAVGHHFGSTALHPAAPFWARLPQVVTSPMSAAVATAMTRRPSASALASDAARARRFRKYLISLRLIV